MAKHTEMKVDLSRFGGSALTDRKLKVPKGRSGSRIGRGIPVTYVPARNTVLLSLALSFAETLSSRNAAAMSAMTPGWSLTVRRT